MVLVLKRLTVVAAPQVTWTGVGVQHGKKSTRRQNMAGGFVAAVLPLSRRNQGDFSTIPPPIRQ
jgi:hypothetical protein